MVYWKFHLKPAETKIFSFNSVLEKLVQIYFSHVKEAFESFSFNTQEYKRRTSCETIDQKTMKGCAYIIKVSFDIRKQYVCVRHPFFSYLSRD